MLTMETILSNLPTILSLWTALTLSWGVYIMFAYRTMVKFGDTFKNGHRGQDDNNFFFMVAANVLLVSYLVLEPVLSTSVGDAVSVINIFYGSYLIPCSVTVGRWWFTKPKHVPVDDQLLT